MKTFKNSIYNLVSANDIKDSNYKQSFGFLNKGYVVANLEKPNNKLLRKMKAVKPRNYANYEKMVKLGYKG